MADSVAVAVAVGQGTPVEERRLGCLSGQGPGPTLICIAGIHGNEPAGIHAVRRVLTALESRQTEMTGQFVALAGNVSALERGCRFIDRDLNRAWTTARLAKLRENGQLGGTVEDREQVELLEEIESILRTTSGPVYALDLHTTSGPCGTFSVFSDSLPLRDFASRFPIPMVLGLEELVDGTLLSLLGEHGLIAITVETGQHEEPAAIDRAEAAIWIAVSSAGLLPERLMPEVIAARELLHHESRHLPRVLEMRYKHDVRKADGFVMSPGYANFHGVAEGQVVGHDNGGDVVAEEDGRLLMPLYQKQGEDGFFLVREFSPFWMAVSRVLRRVGVARVAHWLPGVARVEGTDDEVMIDKRVARFFARQLFHLLGFRQMEDAGKHLVMRRRRVDQGRYLRQLRASWSPLREAS